MKKEYGFGLIAAVFVILLLSMLTIYSVSLFSTDTEIALNGLRSAQALYLCEGGLNYCIKNELIDDTDWTDNTDKVNIPIGIGSFSLYYDPNTTASKVTARVVAAVDDVTRQITQTFERFWPDEQADFPYSIFAAGTIGILSSPGLSIEEPSESSNPDCPFIACDFDYYDAIADTRIIGDWDVEDDANTVYNGIYYVEGDVSFTTCNNITINGSIIANGGGIVFRGCKGVTINPSGNHPALVVSGSLKNITFGKQTASGNEDIVINGMLFARNGNISIAYVTDLQITGIICSAGVGVVISNTDNCLINGAIISKGYVNFFSCGGTGPDINWGSKVLDEPPGFIWGEITMGQWEESY